MTWDKTQLTSLKLALLIPALFLGACEKPEQELQLADLTPSEHTYIQRIVILERAKAVAFNDRDLGNTLLDSLAVAWGDSAEAATAALAPEEPLRCEAVHELLKRIIISERDSLVQSPYPYRLAVPLADPVAKPPAPEQPAPAEKTK